MFFSSKYIKRHDKRRWTRAWWPDPNEARAVGLVTHQLNSVFSPTFFSLGFFTACRGVSLFAEQVVQSVIL